MVHDYLQEAIRRIDEELELNKEALAAGRPDTYEEYKRLTGVIQGLTLAKSHLQALLTQVDTDE